MTASHKPARTLADQAGGGAPGLGSSGGPWPREPTHVQGGGLCWSYGCSSCSVTSRGASGGPALTGSRRACLTFPPCTMDCGTSPGRDGKSAVLGVLSKHWAGSVQSGRWRMGPAEVFGLLCWAGLQRVQQLRRRRSHVRGLEFPTVQVRAERKRVRQVGTWRNWEGSGIYPPPERLAQAVPAEPEQAPVRPGRAHPLSSRVGHDRPGPVFRRHRLAH